MSDPVPAITEAAATGETAAIFADIRQVLGVDVVNLIWRHLATIDNGIVTLTSRGQYGAERSRVVPIMLRSGRKSPGARA